MVQLKRKVTIKTKHAVEEPTVPETPVGGSGNEPKSNKKWLWLVIAAIIVVACVIGFVQLNPSSNNNDGTDSMTPLVESTTVEKTDSIQTKEKQSETDNTDASNGENNDKSDVEGTNASSSASNQSTESEHAKTKGASTAPQNASAQSATSENRMPTGSVEDEAHQVIRGVYGNGSVRKQKLGSRYSEIQSKVNDMYRNGQVH